MHLSIEREVLTLPQRAETSEAVSPTSSLTCAGNGAPFFHCITGPPPRSGSSAVWASWQELAVDHAASSRPDGRSPASNASPSVVRRSKIGRHAS